MANERGMKLLVRATRARVVPVLTMPAVVAGSLAWDHSGGFSPTRFALAIIATAATHVGANIVNDIFDEQSGLEDAARRDYRSIATGSGVLGAAMMTRARLLSLAGLCFASAAGAWAWIASQTSAAPLALGVAAIVVACQHSAPPLRYAYPGRGLEEAGAGAVAMLLGAAAYTAHTSGLDAMAWQAPVVPALHLMLVAFHHSFVRWHADKGAGKHTPAAVLGPVAGIFAGRILTIATGIAVVLQTLVFGPWPPGAAIAALAIVPILVAESRALEEPSNDTFVRMLGSTLGATVLSAAVLCIAVAIRIAGR